MHERPPPHRRPRHVTAEELALWRQVVRDALPRGGGPAPAAAPAPSPPPSGPPPPALAPSAARNRPSPPPSPARASRRLDSTGPVDLDRRTWQRLRRGLLPIDARLDLHGMTQAEAYAALVTFLAGAQRRGARCVLVITGRGLVRGGTLREATPRWLEEPPNRDRVVSYARATIRHGGEGALYVLLRRAT